MFNRLLPVLISSLVLGGCSSTPEAKTPSAKSEPDPSKFRDDPVVVSDGSVRVFFRSSVFPTEAISPVYGCCLAAPAVRGKKEVRVYRPSAAGSNAVSLAKTLPLNEADVLQFHLERQGDGGGWVPVDNDKFPIPQFVFFRRDLSKVETLAEAQYADFGLTGRSSWIISSEMPIKPADELDAFGKSLNMRREYVVRAKSKIRLGRIVVRRSDNSSDTVELSNGCSAVEICTGPNCLAGMNSPCPGEAAPAATSKL